MRTGAGLTGRVAGTAGIEAVRGISTGVIGGQAGMVTVEATGSRGIGVQVATNPGINLHKLMRKPTGNYSTSPIMYNTHLKLKEVNNANHICLC